MCDRNFSFIFAFDSQCIGFRSFDTCISFGFGFTNRLIFHSRGNAYFAVFLGNGNFYITVAVRFGNLGVFFAVGHCFTGFTNFFLLCNTNFSFVNGFCSSFFTQGLDITRLVSNICNVYVYQSQTDFFQFTIHVFRNIIQKLIAVGVNFFNRHGGNYQTQLTEKNIFGQILNIFRIQSQQTFSSCVHVFGFGRNGNGKTTRHVDTNVLTAQCIGQIGFDRKWFQIQKCIILNYRPNKSTASVNTFGRSAACFTVNN